MEEQIRRNRVGWEIYEWIDVILSTMLGLILVCTFVVRIMGVDGHSMVPTLQDKDMLLILSSALSGEYRYGDIVILRKDSFNQKPLVKRVIATGGQTVDINYETGSLYVDGELREEPYIKEQMTWPRDSEMWETHFEIPEGCVFVLGDNRNNSTDSRKPTVGAVDERFVLGGARIVLFPPTRWKLLG